MKFSEMTQEQKSQALQVGKIVRNIGQGNFNQGIIINNDGLDVEVEWENGGTDWISIKSFGPTWKSINV